MSPRILEIAERRFGKLTALFRTPEKEGGYFLWECACECGGRVRVSTKKLMRGTVRDCGCVPRATAANGQTAEDIAGRRFGMLTAVTREPSKGGKTRWRCVCDCGETKVAFTWNLKSGRTWHCGCMARRPKRGSVLELCGERFGRLVALRDTGKRSEKGSVIWECVCDCGGTAEVTAEALVHGGVVSCGCRRQEIKESIGETLTFVDGTCVEWLRSRKHRSDNKSGFRGVYKAPGGKYRASIGFKGRRFHLGTFDNFDDAKQARLEAESALHDDFVLAWEKWSTAADANPDWAAANPFIFEAAKIDGRILVHSPILDIRPGV